MKGLSPSVILDTNTFKRITPHILGFSRIQKRKFCAQEKLAHEPRRRKYKGVTQTTTGKFRSWRRVGDVVHIGGIFGYDEDAAMMSDVLARELWFSGQLNFPKEPAVIDAINKLSPKQQRPPGAVYVFAYSGIMVETDIWELESQVDNIFEKANTFNPQKNLSGRLTFFPINTACMAGPFEKCGSTRTQVGETWQKPVWGKATYFRDPNGAKEWRGQYGCYQILEGNQDEIEALYSRVSNDSRVEELVVHYSRKAPFSSFPTWGMQVEVTNSIIDWTAERNTLRFA